MSVSRSPVSTLPFDGRADLPAGAPRVSPEPLPMTRAEMKKRGWSELDIVFVTGDAYIDHPSFAMAILGRLLESAGYRVGIVSQPDWRSAEPWKALGKPRLFFAVSAGNMDSMINHYTANKKVRNDDAYSPGGAIGRRPDRATLAYCQRAREAYPGTMVVAGGVEASLRRITHYDYWSDKVRRSILMDCKADLLAFGMGERTILDIADCLRRGGDPLQLRSLRGVAYRLGSSTPAPTGADVVRLPSHEEAVKNMRAFADMTRLAHMETNPLNGRRLVQRHADQTIVVNPPSLPLSQAEMDHVYGLPFTRKPHPAYGNRKIPAFEVIQSSVQIMRGCFGGCTFCSITAHEGRIIQSRSHASVLTEVKQMAADPQWKGTVSDIGGPTANMYEMRCTKPEVEKICRRQSCVHPTICKLLGTDHKPLIQLMRDVRNVPGVKQAFVASGIRMDLARRDPNYMKELTKHHVGGYLKVAPEHTDARVLEKMKKPGPEDFVEFDKAFRTASKQSGKDQYLIPYYISSHPGSDLTAMIDLALFLKRHGYKPDQVQDFIPSPFDIAACMYHTGLDPMTMKPVYTAKHMQDRRMQRALLQFFKPENYFEVRSALLHAKRADLIGNAPQCLIPAAPPLTAIIARRQSAKRQLEEQKQGDHIRGGPGSKPTERPSRTSVASGKTSDSKSARQPSGKKTGGKSERRTPGGRKVGRKPVASKPATESGSSEGYRPHRRTSRRRQND